MSYNYPEVIHSELDTGQQDDILKLVENETGLVVNSSISLEQVLTLPHTNIEISHNIDIDLEECIDPCVSKWDTYFNAVSYQERTHALYDFVRTFVDEYESNTYIGHVLVMNQFV
jgi:hypothetical protein